MKTKIQLLVNTLILLTALFCTSFAPKDNSSLLKESIKKVISLANAHVGVGIMGLNFNDRLVINNAGHYPMQSVYKFPLAMAILHQVDAGKYSLAQKIHIPKKSLDTATWSPMVKDFPNQDIDMTLSNLLIYTVSKSDNNGCDVLFRLMGGTALVNAYIHSLGVKDIAIAATEAEMKTKWQIQYTNWCQPMAMLQLLDLFYKGKALSKTSNAFLMKIMTESENSPTRIKGLLPPNAIVAHKTGTSNTNAKGIRAATNDVGIITLPNGKNLAIVIYVADAKMNIEESEKLIAKITKLAWDHYNTK